MPAAALVPYEETHAEFEFRLSGSRPHAGLWLVRAINNASLAASDPAPSVYNMI